MAGLGMVTMAAIMDLRMGTMAATIGDIMVDITGVDIMVDITVVDIMIDIMGTDIIVETIAVNTKVETMAVDIGDSLA